MTPSTNPKVDAFLGRTEAWRDAFVALRAIIGASGLVEDFKWGWPCYTLGGKNVVLIHGFKDYCAILFMKGALLKDPDGVLVQQTENVQSARHLRFTTLDQIAAQKALIQAYVAEAIEVERSGRAVPKKPTDDFPMVEELQARLADDPDLSAAFDALTPGRQRAWRLHFAQAKQSKTRETRIDKAAPSILAGKGPMDD